MFTTHLCFSEQCFFDVPKCPFTDVFDGQNRPTTTTAAPKTTATTPAKHTPDVAGVETNLKTTQKVGTETVSKETKTTKPTVQTTTTLPTTQSKLAKHSSDDTSMFLLTLIILYTIKMLQLVNKMCRNRLVANLSTSCNNTAISTHVKISKLNCCMSGNNSYWYWNDLLTTFNKLDGTTCNAYFSSGVGTPTI